MKIGWGWKIAGLYSVFVVLILILVFKANSQHFDLVSKDYYDAEIGYQKVLDAGKNQSALAQPISIHANKDMVSMDMPDEFKSKVVSGKVQFYSPVNSEWDRTFQLNPENNTVSIRRTDLRNTRYTIKISFEVEGKSYYQESEIFLQS